FCRFALENGLTANETRIMDNLGIDIIHYPFFIFHFLMNFTILRFDELESTNTEAANQARRGAGEGLCVVARRQTAGRGRHGREWISEKDAGLYFRLVLRPKIEARFLPLITLTSAVAVFETLGEFGLKPDIKWANDVHVRERKICGILAETCETNLGLAIVAGIGINLKSSSFPPELKETAASIEDETNRIIGVDKLLQILTHYLSMYCEILYGEDGAENIRNEWTKRSSYAFGKEVRVRLENNETIYGATRGIEADGALRIEQADGAIKIVRAGEVEKLRLRI
ncbi:MAG TPA: biotin--[acetyl-CoA-carboxylase] ligase, partial [Pyrinomonadaceae bacterium]|nr:biotin--[acetyl-CoA-carboxylase] ligase [Pyrinomonadaceae bacterium]